MRRALILCAGDNPLWKGDGDRHLVEIDGETLLDRTVRQCVAVELSPVVVATDPDVRSAGAEVFNPGETSCIAETLKATRPLWHGDMLVLLGDVRFSDGWFQAISSAVGVRVFGRKAGSDVTNNPSGENFALTFGEGDFERVMATLDVCIADAATIPDAPSYKRGSLWQIYRHLAGFDLHTHSVEDRIWQNQPVGDCTDDVDSPRGLKRMKRLIEGRRVRVC